MSESRSYPYPYAARVLADSVSLRGCRLTTLEVTLPRIVLSEFNTHRVFSRNSASTRAIPVARRIEEVLERPFVPLRFGVNRPGMSAAAYLEGEAHDRAVGAWLRGRDRAVETARELLEIGAHKQLAGRALETYLLHTIVVTATEWSNFFALRISPDAQPEIKGAALAMRRALEESTPHPVDSHGWHMPLIQPDELELALADPEYWLRVSVGRCARVSYLTHDGRRDQDADIALHDRLLASGHMSPAEHVARPMTNSEIATTEWSGNFRGWVQYRKTLPGEADYSTKNRK